MSPTSPPPHDTLPVLRIEVSEDKTFFSGLANVYRYDRPSPADIATYVKKLLGPDPAGYPVHIVADDDTVDRIDHALAGYDVVITAEKPSAVALTQPRGDVLDIPRPAATSRTALPRAAHLDWAANDGALPGWVVPAVIVLVSIAVAAVIWFTAGAGLSVLNASGRSGGFPTSEVTAQASSQATTAPPESTFRPGGVGTEASTSERPPTAVIERDGLRVELPHGFRVVPDGDMWRATGDDPNFRLEMDIADLYHMPQEEMRAHVLREIEADPEVELVTDANDAIVYRQRAADGSEALWKTWASAGKQLFIGCHTHFTPTTVQEATCHMAMDSATYVPDSP